MLACFREERRGAERSGAPSRAAHLISAGAARPAHWKCSQLSYARNGLARKLCSKYKRDNITIYEDKSASKKFRALWITVCRKMTWDSRKSAGEGIEFMRLETAGRAATHRTFPSFFLSPVDVFIATLMPRWPRSKTVRFEIWQRSFRVHDTGSYCPLLFFRLILLCQISYEVASLYKRSISFLSLVVKIQKKNYSQW